ncbi:hypothetical protein [uncultured Draconibacterium sp.]|uniref:hypothetical protein n=1 Tax=uncultured Draconibacterium sp. TaxID=1573823 RepID=UPI002600D751|nr:hypothetical protein [uncultured Draconibacterium sp.]
MNKSIIISGPMASGKNWIASAIASTHPKERVLNTYSHVANKKVDDLAALRNLDVFYDLIIVDECKDYDDIFCLNDSFMFTPSRYQGWKGTEPHIVGGPKYTVVYLTQQAIQLKDVDQKKFTVINCRNQF